MSVSRDGGASNAVEPSLLGFVDSDGAGGAAERAPLYGVAAVV